MASTIEIINRSGDKRLLLAQSQLARTMAIGSDWAKLRVGVTMSLDGAQENITGTPRLLMGLNSGTSNLPFDETPGHFIGVRTNVASMTYAGTALSYGISDTIQLYKNLAGVETTSNLTSARNMGISRASENHDYVNGPSVSTWFLDLEKVDASTMGVVFASQEYAANEDHGLTESAFKQAMTLEDIADAVVFGTQAKTSSGTVSIDEASDGFLDTICIAWDRLISLEVSKVSFARLA
jgi:hypothetical protein